MNVHGAVLPRHLLSCLYITFAQYYSGMTPIRFIPLFPGFTAEPHTVGGKLDDTLNLYEQAGTREVKDQFMPGIAF